MTAKLKPQIVPKACSPHLVQVKQKFLTLITISSNIVIREPYRSSANYSQFLVFDGLKHLIPYENTITIPLVLSSHYASKQDQASTFVQWIEYIHCRVHIALQKPQAKHNGFHDEHWLPSTFQVGDHVWIPLSKKMLQTITSFWISYLLKVFLD